MKRNNIDMDLTISTDKKKINLEVVLRFLKEESYWAQNRSREITEKAIQNSLCFSLYNQNEMIGFARVVTDKVTFFYLCDVFIIPDYQYKGVGQFFMKSIVNHPELKYCRGFLTTQTAHTFYEKFGFTQNHEIIGKRLMIKPEK